MPAEAPGSSRADGDHRARGRACRRPSTTSSPGRRPSAAATGGLWVTKVPVWPGGMASTRCSAVLPPSRITTWPGSSSVAAARAVAILPSTAWACAALVGRARPASARARRRARAGGCCASASSSRSRRTVWPETPSARRQVGGDEPALGREQLEDPPVALLLEHQGSCIDRVDDELALVARDRDHLVGARRGAADPQHRVAARQQPARDRVEDLVEDRVADALAARDARSAAARAPRRSPAGARRGRRRAPRAFMAATLAASLAGSSPVPPR